MNKLIPRAGSSAKVIRSRRKTHSGLEGRIVSVLTAPQKVRVKDVVTGRFITVLANQCEFDTTGLNCPFHRDGAKKWVLTACLRVVRDGDHERAEIK